MAAVGGSIETVSIRGRSFSIAHDADGSRILGGYESEVQPNGDGTVRKIKMRKPWSLGGLSFSIDDDLEDQEFLQDRANENVMQAVEVTFASGVVMYAEGTVTGEVSMATQNATSSLTLSGPGLLSQ